MRIDKKSNTNVLDKRTKIINGLTKLSRTSGKISLECEECGIEYETYACWAKRYSHHYCSFACASAGKERPVKCNCVQCGKEFVTIPSYLERKKRVTCSEECESEKKRISAIKNKNLPAPRVGKDSNLSKLSEDVIIAIRKDESTQSIIAKKYGVTQSYVSMIKSRKVWAHLEG